MGGEIYECAGECHEKSFPGEPFIESSVDIPAQLWQIALTPTFFDSGDRTFLQRGSPPPPPWRLLPESLFYSNPLTMRAAWRSLPPSQFAGGVAQLVRALACHARGRGFESRRSRHFMPPFFPPDPARTCGPSIARHRCCQRHPMRRAGSPVVCRRCQLPSSAWLN